MKFVTPLLAWAMLSANSAHALTPPPIPPDPVALEKARELLAVAGAAEHLHFGMLSRVEQHVRDRLLAAAGSEARGPFGRLLAETFRRQARDGLSLVLPAYIAARAEVFARLMSPDQLDAATTFFRSDAGKRIALILFGDSDATGLEESVFITLVDAVPATVAEVHRSAEVMRRVNNDDR